MEAMRDVCQSIGAIIKDKPTCIETGTMYVRDPGNEVHTTTNNILEFICAPKDGALYSLDIDPQHINFSEKYNREYAYFIRYYEGDSVVFLRKLSSLFLRLGTEVDLLCFDGKEFAEDHMVNEFEEIKSRLAKEHFILVDDVHNPNSVKWKKMVPLLKELDYSYTEVPTPTGLFVAWKGYEFKGA